jgi:uncharacterized membrane protein YqaE (UPF0057 family)
MRYFLCIFLPPVAVLTTGRLGAFLLNLLLTLFFWIPGVIHSILVTQDYYAARRHRELLRATRRHH